MTDRRTRRDIAAIIATVAGDGEIQHDLTGPAAYRLGGQPMTVIACIACHHVGLVPSIPARPVLFWECGGCRARIRLEPPPAVWLEGSRPTLVAVPGVLQ